MATIDSLSQRIDSAFATFEGRVKQVRSEQVQEHHDRQARLEVFQKLLTELSAIWKPRLESLAKRFGDKVKITPRINAGCREATLEFQSELAQIRLRLSAATDQAVRNLILEYDLEILPVFIQFDSHQMAEWPLDAIDREGIAKWVDDRLVGFVQTYLSLHENEYYLKDHMVVDPIAGVRFPKFAAAAKIELNGKTQYFISEETRREFEAKQKATAK